jgi:signal peptidase I
MKISVLTIIFVAFIILTGCSEKQPIKDELTKYDLPVIEKPDNKQIIHMILSDGMYRSEQYGINSQLVIDSSFYDTKEITRGDVVYFRTTATEEEIKSKKGMEFDVARVIALPGETVTVKKGQVYIDDRELDTLYGKEYYTSGYIAGTDKAYTMNKKVQLSEGHYFLAGDVWWRSGFNEQVSKNRISGKVVGWMKK